MTNRRDFLKTSVLASSLLFVPKFLHALDRQGVARLSNSNGRRLVVIQLGGGNDGLNTLVPYRNDLYYKARPTLALREQSGLLTLNDELALNPAMTKLKALYDDGRMGVLNSVGYPNPDRSHFRSMDIWQSGSAADQIGTTGWLGRYLDSSCAECQVPYNGVEVDDTLSLAMKGGQRKGLALKNPEKFHQITQNHFIAQVSSEKAPGGASELDYLYKTLAETSSSADYLYQTSKVYKSSVTYPNTEFGRNLRTTAELINSGLGNARVLRVALGLRYARAAARAARQAARRLGGGARCLRGRLAERRAVRQHARHDLLGVWAGGCSKMPATAPIMGRPTTCCCSEGALRKPGILNAAPDLAQLDQGDLRYQLDFRSVYATVLRDWLGADDTAVLGSEFERLAGIV